MQIGFRWRRGFEKGSKDKDGSEKAAYTERKKA